MNRWTKMYLQGLWANYGLTIIMLTIFIGVSAFVLWIGTITDPYENLAKHEKELLAKERDLKTETYVENRRGGSITIHKEPLTNIEKEALVLIKEKMNAPPPEPPSALTDREQLLLNKDQKLKEINQRNERNNTIETDSEEVVVVSYRRGEVTQVKSEPIVEDEPEVNSVSYRRSIDKVVLEPFTDAELAELAVAKDKLRALNKWTYDNYETPNIVIFFLIPLFAIICMMTTIVRGRTDLGNIAKVRDMEKRMEKIRKHGAEAFIEKNKATLVDANDKGIELYETYHVLRHRNPPKVAKFVVYRDTSTGETYMSFVPPDTMTANAGMAYKQRLHPSQYRNMVLES